jgi:4-carboxymuconolactone decarboxylase
MPPLAKERMTDAQRRAAEGIAAGPRGEVSGPFIPLLRSPELMDRLQKVGEYLRFQSTLDASINEFVTLIVSRSWTQQFEWRAHVPRALKAGVSRETIDALAEGRRPPGLSETQTIAYELCDELLRTHGVSDTTFDIAVREFGESGLIDLLGLVGYFTTLSMIMNVARTPAARDESVAPLTNYPLA